MRLNDGEILELDIKPDEKLLIIWFFTKTVTYSIAAVFFIFMALFFINTINLASDVNLETDPENETEIVQNGSSKEQTGSTESADQVEINHPFTIMVDYWPWALALAFLTSIIMQIYFIYLRKTYRYIITNRRCIFAGGILKRIERSVPYKKITDIQRSQNLLERILGIWNVQIYTPGTASMQIGQAKGKAELNYDGLLNSEELYETIHKHTQLNG